MSLELDPQEVLGHLYSLGYYNITKDQLKEFIKDLTKLIKHDIRKEQKKCCSSHTHRKVNKENGCNCSSSQKTDCCCCHCPTTSPKKSTRKSTYEVQCDYSSSNETLLEQKLDRGKHLSPSTELCPCCAKYLHHLNRRNNAQNYCIQDRDDPEVESTTEEEYLHSCIHKNKNIKETAPSRKKPTSATKTCPSFIKPSSAKGKPAKADPVALYHYYKNLWSQHTLPGESSHEDLRWRIRHRMMAPPEEKCICTLREDTLDKKQCKSWKRPLRRNKNKIFCKKYLWKEKCEHCASKKLNSVEIILNFNT